MVQGSEKQGGRRLTHMNADSHRLDRRQPAKSYCDFKHTDLTDRIIKAAYNVYNDLGFGFAEKVYENAMAIEMKALCLDAKQQAPIQVRYQGHLVGDYVADFVIEDKVIVELKAVEDLDKAHQVQLVNYLKATGIEIGLLINFGRRMSLKRKVFTQARSA